MAIQTAQQITNTGTQPTYNAAAAGGDKFAYTANAFIHVKNGDTAAHTVSVVSQYAPVPGIAPADIAVSIPAGEERMIGPFNRQFFENADGDVELTYDAVTSVTLAVLRL